MAPTNRTFRTYGRPNSSISSVTAFNLLLAKNLTKKKLSNDNGKRLASSNHRRKKQKVELKELPQIIKSLATTTMVGDESLHVNVDVNDTFDRVRKLPDLNPVSKKSVIVHNHSSTASNNSSEVSSQVRMLRSFVSKSISKEPTSSSVSWFMQQTPTGEAITNSLEIENGKVHYSTIYPGPSSNSKLVKEQTSSIVLRSHSQSLPKNTSIDLRKKPKKNTQFLQPIQNNSKQYNSIFTNSVRERIHCSTPLTNQMRQKIVNQPPVSPIVPKETDKLDIKECVIESLKEIKSWNFSSMSLCEESKQSSIVNQGRSRRLQVELEQLPITKFISVNQEEFENFHRQNSSDKPQITQTSINQEEFEKFHSQFINSANYMLRSRSVAKNISNKSSKHKDISSDLFSDSGSALLVTSLNEFEKFERNSRHKIYSSFKDISSFLASGRKQPLKFVTHRKHKISGVVDHNNLIKNLMVVLDRGLVNFSNERLELSKQPTSILRSNRKNSKQLSINLTRYSLNKLKKQLQTKSEKNGSRVYKACRKFSSNSSRLSHQRSIVESVFAQLRKSIVQSVSKSRERYGSRTGSLLDSECSSEKENTPVQRLKTARLRKGSKVLFKTMDDKNSNKKSDLKPDRKSDKEKKEISNLSGVDFDLSQKSSGTPLKDCNNDSKDHSITKKEYVAKILTVCLDDDVNIRRRISRRSSRLTRSVKSHSNSELEEPPQETSLQSLNEKSYIAKDLSGCIDSGTERNNGFSSSLFSFQIIDLTSDSENEVSTKCSLSRSSAWRKSQQRHSSIVAGEVSLTDDESKPRRSTRRFRSQHSTDLPKTSQDSLSDVSGNSSALTPWSNRSEADDVFKVSEVSFTSFKTSLTPRKSWRCSSIQDHGKSCSFANDSANEADNPVSTKRNSSLLPERTGPRQTIIPDQDVSLKYDESRPRRSTSNFRPQRSNHLLEKTRSRSSVIENTPARPNRSEVDEVFKVPDTSFTPFKINFQPRKTWRCSSIEQNRKTISFANEDEAENEDNTKRTSKLSTGRQTIIKDKDDFLFSGDDEFRFRSSTGRFVAQHSRFSEMENSPALKPLWNRSGADDVLKMHDASLTSFKMTEKSWSHSLIQHRRESCNVTRDSGNEANNPVSTKCSFSLLPGRRGRVSRQTVIPVQDVSLNDDESRPRTSTGRFRSRHSNDLLQKIRSRSCVIENTPAGPNRSEVDEVFKVPDASFTPLKINFLPRATWRCSSIQQNKKTVSFVNESENEADNQDNTKRTSRLSTSRRSIITDKDDFMFSGDDEFRLRRSTRRFAAQHSGEMEKSPALRPSWNRSEADDVFKIPDASLTPFKTTGKSWRRSLIQHRRESCNVTRDSYRPSECIRLGTIIVPSDVVSSRRKTILRNYAESILPVTDQDLILNYCQQTSAELFDKLFAEETLINCRKIGEGVYGEVFMYTKPDGRPTVMKVIPIEGDLIVNGERQKKFHEILSEVVISSKLSDLRRGKTNKTSGFCEVQRVCLVEGRYPKTLVRLWHDYASTKGSENDPPDNFSEDQLYIVLELSNAGQDLEAFVFNNAQQALSIFKQVACALAVAEEQLQFEHRDLHWGNILIRKVNRHENVTYIRKGKRGKCETIGVEATLIDFTLSRIESEGVTIFSNLAADPELFESTGDYQFDIYRLMRDHNGNNWRKFTPYTNVLWLHYVLDKCVTALRYKNIKTKVHTKYIDVLMKYRDSMLNYNSVSEFVDQMN